MHCRPRYIVLCFCVSMFVAGSAVVVIKKNKNKPSDNSYISTIIVPHHDLVVKQRRETFKKVSHKTQGRRIILLAPNHYNSGVANIQTRSQAFTTQFGDINVDKALFNLSISVGAQEVSTTFEAEHGIKAILPDIANYYPDVSILPIVTKQSTTRAEINRLTEVLNKNCADCLLIVSADFSHYQPYLLSKLHDSLTIRGLENLDGDLLDTTSELEPMHHIYMATKWAKLQNTKRFVLDQHTTSHEEVGDYYSEGTTHIMGWYEKGQQAIPKSSVSFAIAGLLDLDVNSNSQEFSDRLPILFDQLGERVLWGADLVVGKILTEGKTSSQLATKQLQKLHFTHANTNDRRLIKNIGAKDLGSITQINGQNQKITMLAGLAKDISVDKIKAQKDNVIIYVDWGNLIDKEKEHSAHSWVDNGADIIIGVGESKVGRVELYKNRLISYSLGSLVSSSEANGYSIVLAGEFTNEKINIYPLMVSKDNFIPTLSRSKEADERLKEVFKDFDEYVHDDRGGLLYSISK